MGGRALSGNGNLYGCIVRIMKLTVVRHAETIENVQGIIQGHARGTLTEHGISQAKQAAQKLRSESIDVIYCSDLSRCVDTAKEIIKYHPNTAIHYTEQLREMDAGVLDKYPFKVPDFISNIGALIIKYFNVKLPGAESVSDLRLRVRRFINVVYKEHPNDRVLFITHGLTMRAIEAVVNGSKTIDVRPIKNCEIWRLDIEFPLE